MNSKVLAGIVAIVVIAACGVGIWYMLGGGSDDGYDPSPVMKSDLEVGDYYTVVTETGALGEGDSETTTYTITAVNGDSYTVSTTTDGGPAASDIMTKEQFLTDMVPTDDDLTGLSVTDTVAYQTSFGKLKCEIWEGTVFGITAKMWICPDNGVMFHGEGEAEFLGTSVTTQITLVDTNMFDVDDGTASADLSLRTDLRVGDTITIKVWEAGSSGDESYDIPGTESMTITSIDGDSITVLFSMDDEPAEEIVVSPDQFLANLTVPTDDAKFDRQETLHTPWGDVTCDVFTMASPSSGGFDKYPTVSIWVNPASGISLKVVTSVDDATSGDHHLDHWELGAEVTVATVISG